ncbi:iron-siderophore ABC transporter substrate-binding protein (plasmid) [Picosynechococcus sp. PCC 11901]|uniref:ABC transporter substrate-binding protein n=1 Tax=Picosynechococcus sp. PCC 11901 TaxID=2579791 RepID=UPI0010FBD030|nr:iron-siderophore ABC transporter substrate-binding protein [Picosynechococcus sp. PCC 11901]QCS51086.1 iron-siderophore ABC transporter substrate-binding protein [Picosynechococcus sp. PCC 11901]
MLRFFHLPYWLLSVCGFLIAILLGACAGEMPETPVTTDCREVPHLMGSTTICGTPQKVVVLGDHSLDLLLSLGRQPAGLGSVNAFAHLETFDNPEAQIPYLGQFVTTQPVNVGDSSQPSLEVLTQLKPDLIVGEGGRNQDNYKLLSQIAPTLLWDIRTKEGQWQKNIQALALALGSPEKETAAIARYDNLVAEARSDLSVAIEAAPKALLLGASRLNSGEIIAITPKSYLGELMESLGFQVIAPPTTLNYAPLSLEVLPTMDEADRIFVLGYDVGNNQDISTANTDELLAAQTAGIEKDWAENAIAQALPASQADQVYFATYWMWNGLNGPLGTELILEELRQFLLAQ